MAAFRSDSIKKAQIPSVCHLCETSKTIQWKCIDCDLLLCDVCKIKVHSKFKSADTHDVISLKDIGKESNTKRGALNANCKTHPTHHVCLYCRNCDVVACPSCVSESHTKHHLESFGKIHDKTVDKLTYAKDELQADLKVMIDNEKKIDEKITTDKQRYETTKTDILRHLEEIKRLVDQEGGKMLERLDRNWIDVETANKANKSNISRVQEDIRSKITIVKDVLDRNDTMAGIRCEKKLSSEWTHRQDLDKPETKLMEFNHGIVDRQSLINIIGALHKSNEQKIQFDILKSKNTNMGSITNLQACKDGHVFVCDEYASCIMKKMVLKESEFKETQNFSRLKVFDITETDKKEFILSFTDKTYLKRIKTCGTMEDYVDFSPWQPRALHITSTGNLFVSGREQGPAYPVTENSDRKIVIVDANGERRHDFQFDDENERLFSMVYRLKTLKNNDIVVINLTNYKFEGNIISIRYPNTKIWTYKGQSGAKMFCPLAIEITETDNILIADRENHTLHILNPFGSIVTVVNLENYGITLPQSLAIDSNKLLWVGDYDRESKKSAGLYIFKISGF